MNKKIAVTAQGIEQIMREAIGIGEKYEGMKRAMEWWKKRYRKADAMLEEAGIVSRAQAKNFADMAQRASSAESSLAAMRQRAEEAEQVSITICNIVDRLRLKFEIQRNVNFTGDVVVKEFILAREELNKALSCNNKDSDKC